MARFKVGQRVVYRNEKREEVGLPQEVNALVEGVHPVIKDRPPVYTIGWLPTGRAAVRKSEIRAKE